jgi:hypothetical protein
MRARVAAGWIEPEAEIEEEFAEEDAALGAEAEAEEAAIAEQEPEA